MNLNRYNDPKILKSLNSRKFQVPSAIKQKFGSISQTLNLILLQLLYWLINSFILMAKSIAIAVTCPIIVGKDFLTFGIGINPMCGVFFLWNILYLSLRRLWIRKLQIQYYVTNFKNIKISHSWTRAICKSDKLLKYFHLKHRKSFFLYFWKFINRLCNILSKFHEYFCKICFAGQR